MNANEREALAILGDQLDLYSEAGSSLRRLDERAIGWLIFRPHLALLPILLFLPLLLVNGRPPFLFTGVLVLAVGAVGAAGAVALGRWQWRTSTRPLLELVADRLPDDPNALPKGMHVTVPAMLGRLRGLADREGVPRP